jgi:hypothetical protein
MGDIDAPQRIKNSERVKERGSPAAIKTKTKLWIAQPKI